MKEKLPLMSTTPVPTTSTAIAAEAAKDRDSIVGGNEPRENEVNLAGALGDQAEPDELGTGGSTETTPKMSARDVSVFY